MKLTVGKGIDEYISALSKISNASDRMIGEAIYQGAGIVADRIKANINGMKVDDAPYAEKRSGIRTIQKKGLANSFGITKMQNERGYMNVKLGFDGYNTLVTDKYPSGQPNAMIARTYEGGNSFTKKQPFVSPAIRATRDQAEQKMAQVIDTEVSKIYSQ